MAGERWGSYLLEERLATGGMAEVFRARRVGVQSFTRQVCIKRMHARLSTDPEFIEMFLDEAKTGSKLRHRNIVTIEDLGENSGQYFLAMEYVNGVDLRHLEERLRSSNAWMPADAGAYIAAEILAALHAAHTAIDPDDGAELKVIHRDVSPHNVMVSFAGEVKLTDFGIARATRRTRAATAAGVVRGRFGYMPVEQATGSDLDHRADLYALGATLFEMFAGRRPFCGDDPNANSQQIMTAQVTGNRPRLAALRPDLPPALLDLVERMLASEPAQRPPDAASALALVRALSVTLTGVTGLAAVMTRLYPNEASVAQLSQGRGHGEDIYGATDVEPHDDETDVYLHAAEQPRPPDPHENTSTPIPLAVPRSRERSPRGVAAIVALFVLLVAGFAAVVLWARFAHAGAAPPRVRSYRSPRERPRAWRYGVF